MARKSLQEHFLGWTLSLLFLGGGVGGYFWLVRPPPRALASPRVSPPPFVQTRIVEPHAGSLDLQVDGIVVPFREITVAAEVAGRVATKTDECRAGRVVTKGTPLLEIDRSDYELDVQRLNSQVSQAQASLNELYVEDTNLETLVELANEDIELNRAELTRVQKLSPRAVAEAAVDQAKREELASRNALQSLRNQQQLLKTRRFRLESTKQLAETELKRAQLDLQRTRVVSPVDGVVVRESVEQDSFVQKGTTLVTIEDTSAVEVRCNLKMEQVVWLWRQPSAEALSTSEKGGYQVPPTPVTVTYELEGQRHSWPGRLARYEGIGLDERTRTVPCRVLVENPQAGRTTQTITAASDPGVRLFLVRGMYVTVQLHLTPKVPLVRVPEEAVQPGRTVWTIRDGKLVVHRRVNLVDLVTNSSEGQPVAREWLLEPAGSGIRVGDRVVVSPLIGARDGLEVREQQP